MKCVLINTEKGKATRTKGIKLPYGNNIKGTNEIGYRYLWIIEGKMIKQQRIKEIRKEYTEKIIKAIHKSKVDAGNMMNAINTWAVPEISCSVGMVEWKKSELCSMDNGTWKIINIYHALHPRANVDKPCLPRK